MPPLLLHTYRLSVASSWKRPFDSEKENHGIFKTEKQHFFQEVLLLNDCKHNLSSLHFPPDLCVQTWPVLCSDNVRHLKAELYLLQSSLSVLADRKVEARQRLSDVANATQMAPKFSAFKFLVESSLHGRMSMGQLEPGNSSSPSYLLHLSANGILLDLGLWVLLLPQS